MKMILRLRLLFVSLSLSLISYSPSPIFATKFSLGEQGNNVKTKKIEQTETRNVSIKYKQCYEEKTMESDFIVSANAFYKQAEALILCTAFELVLR